MTSAHHEGEGNRGRRQTAGLATRIRRARVPRVELLEQRTLLATVQLSGGLDEKSTLDSVPQPETEMFFLNTPSSTPYRHPPNDGPAVADGTLTTSNSSSGNPGVSLDIHSQGSVALHGIANVATNAGLADTDGQIGADLPVRIIPTTPDEQPGDRVIVQLSFLYNPTTFASNNAAADFAYQVSYTYNGNTTVLVSKDHQAGGPGITPVGPGTSDPVSGTLNCADRRYIHTFIRGEPRRPYDRAVPRRPHQQRGMGYRYEPRLEREPCPARHDVHHGHHGSDG